MAILNGIVTVLLVITALILIATVLLQPGESNGLGAIAGGAETFFGKNKAKSMEGKLALATKVSAGVFIICALIVAMIGSVKAKEAEADALASFLKFEWF